MRRRAARRSREWTQPLRGPTRAALERCRHWREKAQYHGPWVFFSEDARVLAHAGEPVYTHQALAAALTQAERRAQVPHLELRAMHGLQRLVVGEIVRVTGDLAAAAQFIGDTDLRVVNRSYLKRRDDQLRAVAEQLDAAQGPAHDPRKDNQSATEPADGGVNPLNREPQVGFEPTTACCSALPQRLKTRRLPLLRHLFAPATDREPFPQSYLSRTWVSKRPSRRRA